MGIAWWYEDDIDSRINITDEDSFLEYVKGIDDDVVLNARLGVNLTQLEYYLNSDEVSEGEYIYVIKDGTLTETRIPQYAHSGAGAKKLTLDYTECDGFDSIVYNAFLTDWVSVLKLPSSITEINGIYGITDSIYIPLPSGELSFSSNVSNTASGKTSTYSVHFGGTLADWCSRITLSNSKGSHPFTGSGSFYVLDSKGNEYNASVGSIVIEDQYTTSNGTKAVVSVINNCSLQSLGCESVKLPATVTKLGNSVFEYCPNLKDVWITSTSFCGCANDTFKNQGSSLTVHVPNELLSLYQSGENTYNGKAINGNYYKTFLETDNSISNIVGF